MVITLKNICWFVTWCQPLKISVIWDPKWRILGHKPDYPATLCRNATWIKLNKHLKYIAWLWWRTGGYIFKTLLIYLYFGIIAMEKPPTRCSGNHVQGIQGIQGSCDRHPRSPKAPHIPPDAPRLRLWTVPNCSFGYSRTGRLTLHHVFSTVALFILLILLDVHVAPHQGS